jgi:hypothetical protein
VAEAATVTKEAYTNSFQADSGRGEREKRRERKK